MKKFLALLLALVMTMSLVTVGASAKTAFTDDKDITEVEAVEVLSAMGIIDGYKDGSFKPQGALNRAAGAKFIAYLMLGEKNADGLKATGTVFEDVAADYALAPYVEWCAKMGIVDGYGDGKFGPTNTLTQAAFGKMLLTALGYDSAKEGYTGAGWQKAVYADGLKAGVYGDDGEIFAACNRETAAKLALGALKATMVEYGKGDKLKVVEATAKQDQNGDKELQLFETYKDLKYAEGKDKWGRPGHTWTYGKDFDTFYADEAVATYTVATSYCDICKDLGESKNAQFGKVFKNGVENSGITFSATASTKYGAQGELVEIYDMTKEGDEHNWYRIVMIDTYLAKVESVSELKYDKNDHLKAEAKIVLDVLHSTDYRGGANLTLTDDEANFDYAKGDYVLVNVIDRTHGDILGKADSKDAKQTKIHVNSAKHTIDGTEYNDACKFYNDANMTKTSLYTWFFDQYGNVIGCKEVKEPKNYGVVTYIEKFEGTREGSYILADITYMDQTTVTDVRVASVKNSNGDSIRVDTDPDKNEKTISYFHLYEISVNDDDELELRDQTKVSSAVKTKMTTLVDDTSVKLNNDTLFVVLTGDGSKKTPYEFSFVKGIDEIGNYQKDYVHYVIDEDTGYAEYVLITADAKDAVAYQYLYIDGTAYTKELDKNLVKNYIFEGAVTLDEGEDAEEAVLLTIPATTQNAADETLLKKLVDSKGMPVMVQTTNGKVTAVTSVASDKCAVVLPEDNDFEMLYCGGAINAAYAFEYKENNTLEVRGEAKPYNLNGVKAILVDGKVGSAADLTDEALTDAGIKAVYVVRDTSKTYLAEYVILSSTAATANCDVHPSYTVTLGTVTAGDHTTVALANDKQSVSVTYATGYEKSGDPVIVVTDAATGLAIPECTSNYKNYATGHKVNLVVNVTVPDAQAITYNITYDLAGGTVAGTNPTTYTVKADSFTLSNPTKTGYTFAGWTGTGLTEATKTVTVAKGSTGARAYTATWEQNTYELTISYAGYTTALSNTVVQNVKYEDLSSTVAAKVATISGYTSNAATATVTVNDTTKIATVTVTYTAI